MSEDKENMNPNVPHADQEMTEAKENKSLANTEAAEPNELHQDQEMTETKENQNPVKAPAEPNEFRQDQEMMENKENQVNMEAMNEFPQYQIPAETMGNKDKITDTSEIDNEHNFRKLTRVRLATDFLLTGKVIPRKWEFPDFILQNDELLSNFLGESYKYFSRLSEEKQSEMIAWYETCGERLIEMFGTIAAEDWDGDKPIQINLKKFKSGNPEIYEETVKIVVPEMYPKLGREKEKLIEKAFLESPIAFQNAVLNFTRRRRKNVNKLIRLNSRPDLNVVELFNPGSPL